MKIYLDNCCYNRPFDDQSQERVYLESEAILSILKRGELHEFEIIGSPIIRMEMGKIRDEDKKIKVQNIYHIVHEEFPITESVKARSAEIMALSKIQLLDSFHIAASESANADVLLTTDDKMEKMAAKLDLKTENGKPTKIYTGGFINDSN